ncbi:MAG: cytochrome c biogenesis protein ResB [Burkholderiaceae bacterium]|nr:cytochrome c biogenesis protein ResB [Burkholderiaceae bacterium]
MTASAAGIEVRAQSRWVRDCVELVSSMRFSISLLTVICIASVIGTVVKQHEPYTNYVNQFGPFWAELFGKVGLYTVYSVWWFLLILAFLVLSTSLCIARNVPKIIVDLRTYKEQVREQALASFHHRGQAEVAESRDQAFDRISALLVHGGWKAKVQIRENGTMIAARRGAANKLGYIAAHSAIVLVCVGGLLDGDLIVRAQMALQGKSTYAGGGLMKDVPANYRLGPGTPTFRANLLVPEGARAGTAVINMQDGIVLQDLPFDVELKKFIVDYYETGMPKLFASEIVIHDRETGEALPATVKVNEPAFHRGVAIYQSSFDDGGSALKLRGIPMAAGGKSFEIEGVVGGNTLISNGDAKLTLEFTGLRVINVVNFGGRPADAAAGGGATDVRKVDLVSSFKAHLGSGAKGVNKKELRNVGPSISYKLRDAAGQAREFNNYMLPVELDGQRVFLAGTRDRPDAEMRYLRIPADDTDSVDDWSRLRTALLDPALRTQAAARYVALAMPAGKPEAAAQLATTAERALALFAGAEGARPKPDGDKDSADPVRTVSGLQAISEFIEGSVPVADRDRISEKLLRILNGSLFELLSLTRERAGLAALAPNEKTQAFMTQSVLSLSDSFFYPAPVLFQLADFKQVQASVFQVARAPGKTLVYLGAVLLIIGVFAMLYIRERRLWVWLAPSGAGTKITTALSTTRRTLDADAEFEQLNHQILKDAT